MNHTEFKNSAIAQQGRTSFRQALPMLAMCVALTAAMLVAFANAIH